MQSTVRAQLDIPYEGGEYTGMQMRMMDAPLRSFPLEDDRIHYFISTARLLLVTKLSGANYRVLISDLQGTAATETARSAFQDALDEHFCGSVSLGEPEWATVFRIWKRVTPRYRHGGVLLAGDAAHCHSPAGGQGMNVCVQDAFNLGWKLALVCAGEADESLLDTYEQERRPIAQHVIEGTNALHSIIMAHGTSIKDITISGAEEWSRRRPGCWSTSRPPDGDVRKRPGRRRCRRRYRGRTGCRRRPSPSMDTW